MCHTRKTWIVLGIALGVLLGWANPARGDTYYYDVSTNDTNDATYKIYQEANADANSNVDANTAGHLTLEAARLFNSATNGVWADGDTVNLAKDKVFASGGLQLQNGKSGTTWFSLNGNGATLVYKNTGGTTDVLRVEDTGVYVGYLTIQNWANAATGGGIVEVDAGTNGANASITEFILDNLRLNKSNGNNGTNNTSALTFNQDGAGSKYTNGVVYCLTIDAGTNNAWVDGISNTDEGTNGNASKIWFIDCNVTSCAGSGAANAFAFDFAGEAILIGGHYKNSGAGNIVSGWANAFGPTRTSVVRAYGVESSKEGLVSPGNPAIQALVVENCYLHHVLNGIGIEGDANTHGVGWVRDTLIVRDEERWATDANTDGTTDDQPSDSVAIRRGAKIVVVENTIIRGFDNANPAAGSDYGINVRGASAANGQSVLVRNCIFDGVNYGIYGAMTSNVGFLAVENCYFRNASKHGGEAASILYTGTSANRTTLRLLNNVHEDVFPNTTTKYPVRSSTNVRKDNLGGYNYRWYSQATDPSFGWTPDTTDVETNGTDDGTTFYRPRIVSGAYPVDSPQSPTFAWSPIEPYDVSVFNPGRTGKYAVEVDANTNDTSIVLNIDANTDAAADVATDWFNNQTIEFYTLGGVQQEYRRVVDCNTNTTQMIVHVDLAFENDHPKTQIAVFSAPRIPSCGNLTNATSATLAVIPYEGSEWRDAYGRVTRGHFKKNRASGFAAGALGPAGPISNQFRPKDTRWRGNILPVFGLPKTTLSDLVPDPGQPTGGFGGPLGKFHSSGVN